MPPKISISEAAQSDLPAMVAVTCDAGETNIINRFLYGPYKAEADHKQTEALTASLGKRFTHPTNRCYIHKAVDTETGELVGWSLVRWEEAQRELPAGWGEGQARFVVEYMRAIKGKWRDIIGEKSHVVLGALHVKPERQGQGIGRQLVEYIYSTYELDKELVIVQTNPISEDFYLKLGWKTVDSTDLDLSEYGGKGRGFGLHRSPQMLRYPKDGSST